MVAQGTVANGVVRLDPGSAFPDGARVRVELAIDSPPREPDLKTALRESLDDLAAGRTYCAREVLKAGE